MTARVAVVTGASRGIGLAICTALAQRGAALVLVARDPQRLDAARLHLELLAPGCVLGIHAVDLAQPRLVRLTGAAIARSHPRVDVLIHNAGVIEMARSETAAGLERTWATNVLAPFVLTRALQPVLPPYPSTRVVFMSSMVHRWGRIDRADTQLTHGYSADRAYNQSKLALVALAAQWARRQPGWLGFSMEPGMTDTDFGSNYTGWRALMRRLYRPFMATPAQAADTASWLATAPPSRLENGAHYAGRAVRTPARGAHDPALGDWLWQLLAAQSETLC